MMPNHFDECRDDRRARQHRGTRAAARQRRPELRAADADGEEDELLGIQAADADGGEEIREWAPTVGDQTSPLPPMLEETGA